MKKMFISLLTIYFMQNIQAQKTIALYEGAVPNSKPYNTKEFWEPQHNGDTIVHFISQPTLTIFLPEKAKANGAAVIICPGGGYWIASIVKEGFAVAKKLNENGIAAFVLKYRIPNDSSMIDKSIGPLQDAQRAIQLVRMNAAEWNVDVNKVGIMGFSAGGHVASTAATHFQKSYIDNPDKINLRPDFGIFIYPVISFQDSIGHIGSRDQLIGKNPRKTLLDSFSNELQINKQTPPAFLVHASDDHTVPVMNSINFYESLLKNNVSAEMHIYKGGGHG
ncbi:MAG: alpha/beta hydrolase, partial [Bacteroidota bacterium]|nr:alpha/beta hydrolase [Bacteroidota bacterium]